MGPPLSGKRRLVCQTLLRGVQQDQGVLMVSTTDNARCLQDRYARLFADGEDVRILDCVSRRQGVADGDEAVTTVSSPDDMTGIGIDVSDHLEAFSGDTGNRIALSTLTALLIYSNLQTVFRFMHVITSRIGNGDALGIYILEGGVHEAETVNTLTQLFDGVVRTHDEDPPSIETLPPGAETA